jgi:hypothetical protein
MLFKEIIVVYTENNAESININAEILIVIAADTYNYHLALKGKRNSGLIYFVSDVNSLTKHI